MNEGKEEEERDKDSLMAKIMWKKIAWNCVDG